MRHVAAPLALLPLALASCQATSSQLSEEQKAAITAEIDSLTVEWETTWTGLVRTVYSVAEMREAWPPVMAGLEHQDFEFTNPRTVVLSPEIVWTLRELDYALRDTTGAVVAEGQWNETAVWMKRDGEWKILLGHDDDTTVMNDV